MAELKPCKKCGGMPEFRKDLVETAWGDKAFVCVRCRDCLDRTSRYMVVEDIDQEEILKIVSDLWNKGCVGDGN